MNSLTSRFSKHRRTSAALAALTACLLTGAGAAHASAAVDAAPAVTVRYADLNIGTEQGADALYARIVSAARQVCLRQRLDLRDLHGLELAKACEAQAIAQAVRDVHSPRLAALYGARQRHG
jgi:UrcA family protein